jgi:hypothetical protein
VSHISSRTGDPGRSCVHHRFGTKWGGRRRLGVTDAQAAQPGLRHRADRSHPASRTDSVGDRAVCSCAWSPPSARCACKVDDSLSQLFRSDTPEFRQFEEVTRRFPSTEFDVLVVIEGKTLLDRESVEKFRDLVTDLQLIDGVRGLISMFSARQPPEQGKLPAPLFPEELPEGAEYHALIERVLSNEIIRGKLLSEDGTLALVVLALDPEVAASRGLNDTVGEIRKRCRRISATPASSRNCPACR